MTFYLRDLRERSQSRSMRQWFVVPPTKNLECNRARVQGKRIQISGRGAPKFGMLNLIKSFSRPFSGDDSSSHDVLSLGLKGIFALWLVRVILKITGNSALANASRVLPLIPARRLLICTHPVDLPLFERVSEGTWAVWTSAGPQGPTQPLTHE